MARTHADAYPSLVPSPWAGGDWTVLECQDLDSSTDPAKRLLAIPRNLTKCQALIRFHELQHVRRGLDIRTFGPQPRLSFRKMCEEIAIEKESLDYGIDIRQARDGLDWTNFPLPKDRLAYAVMVLQLIGSYSVSANPELIQYYRHVWSGLADPRDQRMVSQAFHAIQNDPSPRNCDAWADVLAAHFAPPPPMPTTNPGMSQEERAKQTQAEQDEAEAEAEAKEKATRDATIDPSTNIQRTDCGSTEVDYNHPDLPHCPDYVQTHHDVLDIHWHIGGRAPSRMIASTWRMTDQLGPLRYPTQAMRLDGRPFGVRALGGTIGIDASGSMSWAPDELEKAIASLPNLTAGIYCATGKTTVTGDNVTPISRLCVVGHKGRVADFNRRDEPFTGGNGRSDYQALKALMKIGTPPYVWISDGQVHHPDIAQEIHARMQRGLLVRVATVKHAVEYLQYKSVPLSRACLFHHDPPLELDRRRS